MVGRTASVRPKTSIDKNDPRRNLEGLGEQEVRRQRLHLETKTLWNSAAERLGCPPYTRFIESRFASLLVHDQLRRLAGERVESEVKSLQVGEEGAVH